MEDLIGAVLNNHYRIEQFVGSGGMAEVYKARDVDAPHFYAIKVIREQLLEQPSFVQRFRDEAQRLRDLQHPNIVRFYDFVTSDGLAYIVMDYIDGYPLSRLLRLRRQRGEGPLPVEESVRILAQIARALARVHEQGLVHRDVKPGNILIRQSDGAAFLTDLGIAKDLATSAVTHTLIGTFAYLAPEQILRQPVSPATDIYALGTVAYQLFTNHRPFEGPTDDLPTAEMEQRLIEQHLRQLPRPPSTHNPRLSTELDTALSRALAKPPDARYPDVMAFMRAVHDAVRPLLPADMQILSQIDARPVPTRFPARRGRREGGRPRGLLPAVLALALIGIVAAALLMLSGAIPSPFPTPTPSDTATPTAISTTPAPSDTAAPTALPTETPNLTTTAGWLTLEAERLALESTGTALALAVVPASATSTPTPSATPSATPSLTPSPTPTASATATASRTPSRTPTHVPTPDRDRTATARADATGTALARARTPTPTASRTPSPTRRAATRTPTRTATATATATARPIMTATAAPLALSPAASDLPPTPEAGDTPTQTRTPTRTATSTTTRTPTPSRTPTASPTPTSAVVAALAPVEAWCRTASLLRDAVGFGPSGAADNQANEEALIQYLVERENAPINALTDALPGCMARIDAWLYAQLIEAARLDYASAYTQPPADAAPLVDRARRYLSYAAALQPDSAEAATLGACVDALSLVGEPQAARDAIARLRAGEADLTICEPTISRMWATAITPTPAGLPHASVTRSTRLYDFPDRNPIAFLGPGVPVAIEGQTDEINGRHWFLVMLEDGRRGYVLQQYLEWEGGLEAVPVVSPTPVDAGPALTVTATLEANPTLAAPGDTLDAACRPGPLQLNVYTGTGRCTEGGGWSYYVRMVAQGGTCVYNYAWEDQPVGVGVSGSFVMEMRGGGRVPLRGTARVESGGESAEQTVTLPPVAGCD